MAGADLFVVKKKKNCACFLDLDEACAQWLRLICLKKA